MYRKGRCPVLTERVKAYHESTHKAWDGKAEPHHFQRAARGRGNGVLGVDAHPFEGNFARCHECGEEDREVHFCDFVKSFYVGSWPHVETCDAKAYVLVETLPEDHAIGHPRTGRFYVCKNHTAERVAEKRANREVRERARYDAGTFKWRYGTSGKGYEDRLVDLLKWAAMNADLVESDEWLGQIVRKAAGSYYIAERMKEASDGE